ncbi:hypothetical protein HYH03_008500 [Edaphochlamys debaryana]|uniref:BTB domain-containing protein n=1 Tax=Edaphochlamys debaryana TaxID=47281 RepID=A0A835XZY0_9CHLO|nr:hypothetical protein HYH03_008500 [Edaphochlamys debaryana]|eukprot:KAG2493368.1 hypothetical protein HYH03_008500 [Edaphochlamys debaryana]
MALACRPVWLRKMARGLVVRPRPGGGPDQVLFFTGPGPVYELECGAAGEDCALGPQLASVGDGGGQPAYDPTSDASLFPRSTFTISKLDASNQVTDVAGSLYGLRDGRGAGAGFRVITSLAADGRGGVWVADCDRIRRLDTRSGEVTTLAGVQATRGSWGSLTCHPAADGTLWATTARAVCRVRTADNIEGRMELVAGHWAEEGSLDGSGRAARFDCINAVLPVSGGRLLIANGADLRCMDAGGAVTTLLRGCFRGVGVDQMAVLPSGDVGVVTRACTFTIISGGDFAPQAQQPPPAAQQQELQPSTDRLLSLLAPPGEGDAGGSGGSAPSAPSGSLTVRVGDRAFPVQRSVLAAGSEYFARLLAPGGGFAESGGAEVSLPDADLAAFVHLLSYMYGTSLGLSGASSPLLSVPPELLRPTAALAGRLLMGGAVAVLTERLAAAATPASVLSDLAWADAHGLTDLVERLTAYAVRKRKAVELDGLEEFTERCPQQAAKLLRASLHDQ